MLCQPVYRIVGLERRRDLVLGACTFSIALDIDFAKRARKFIPRGDFHWKFKTIVRNMVDCDGAQIDFLDDTAFLSRFSLQGSRACMGIPGNVIGCDWDRISYMTYYGHSIDSKHHAYDLLTIFTYWVDVVEALFFSEQCARET